MNTAFYQVHFVRFGETRELVAILEAISRASAIARVRANEGMSTRIVSVELLYAMA